LKEQASRQAAREHLIPFIEYTKPGYQTAPHHRLIAAEIEAVERGENDRLILCTPPRHGKSQIVSRHFPPWYLGRNPERQLIATSYAGDLASDFGQDARDIISDQLYQNVFNMRLRQDSRARDKWRTNKGGIYVSSGIGGGITGRGMHLGIVDDPIRDWRDADSPTIRNWIWNWYLTTFYTRLMPGGAIIVIATRWHEDDLVGRLLKAMARGGDQWRLVILPAIAKENDLLGRAPGEALWPGTEAQPWFPVKELMRIKNSPGEEGAGSRAFEALYQQSPQLEGGNIFKREWWQYYRALPKIKRVLQSWDTAYEEKTSADYSCCTTWGVGEVGYYLLNVWKGKLELPELKTMARALAEKYGPNEILIEAKASGKSLGQEIKRATKLPIIMIDVDRDKVARAHATTPLIEAGKVHLPEPGTPGSEWLADFLDSVSAFPAGPNDDDVDSMTQALNRFLRGASSRGLFDYYQQLHNEQEAARAAGN
jgi:predicted phage terminase large subunit-like protein